MNKKLVLGIILTVASLFAAPINNVYADSYKSVTIGYDLTNQQKEDMLKYFDVDSNSASVVEVTSNEEKKYLGDTVSKEQLGNKAISCSYIEPTTTGGLVVDTNNYNYNLSKDDVSGIVGLMTNVNKLNLDYSKVKDQLEGVASTMKNTLD